MRRILAPLAALLLIPLSFAVNPEAQSRISRSANKAPSKKHASHHHARPCDFSCCKCAERSFSFKSSHYHTSNKENSSASAAESCLPCYDWVDTWIAPEYKDYCGTVSCMESPYVYFPHDYTVLPYSYYETYDYPVDYYHSDGSVVRHIPGVGNETLPPNWGTGLYGNGWCENPSYYYPHYPSTYYYSSSRHHRANTSMMTEAQESMKKAAAERAEIRESHGANVPSIYKLQRKRMTSPCDLDCCSCASDLFEFATPVTSSCMTCDAWVDEWVIPEYKDTCSCTADVALKPYYTTVPHSYIKPDCDYAHDAVYLGNSTTVRHVPSLGTVSYPSQWDGVPYYSNKTYYSNYVGSHYYYPDYSSEYYVPDTTSRRVWTPSTRLWFQGYGDNYVDDYSTYAYKSPKYIGNS